MSDFLDEDELPELPNDKRVARACLGCLCAGPQDVSDGDWVLLLEDDEGRPVAVGHVGLVFDSTAPPLMMASSALSRAGYVTRMSPAPTAEVIETEGVVAPIVTETTWRQAQTDRAPATPGPRPDRPEHSRYALRGLLVCSRCGRRMQGHVVSRRSGAQRLGYQCTYRNDYPGDESHPKTLFVAEDRVLPEVDRWLAGLTWSAATGATTKELMRRAGHASPGAALRYQHATEDRDQVLAAALADLVPSAGVLPLGPRDGRAMEHS